MAAKVLIPKDVSGIVDDSVEDHKDDVKLFETELAMLSTLAPHNNVIQFFGYQEAINEYVLERRIFMEWSVENVHTFVRQRSQNGKKPIQPIEIALIAIQIAHGIKFLHDQHIIHRNLSSDNVILGIDALTDERRDWLQTIAGDPMGMTLPKLLESDKESAGESDDYR